MPVPVNPSGQAVLKFLPVDPDKGNYNQAVDTITMVAQAFGGPISGLLDSIVSTSTDLYVGAGAGVKVTTGTSNTFVGANAGASVTTSANNVAVGTNALKAETTGLSTTGINTAVGYNALTLATSYGNTAVGYQALGGHTTGASSVGQNTAVGVNAGFGIATGINNTFIGYQAGRYETGAASNLVYIDNLDRANQAAGVNWAPFYALTNLSTFASQQVQINAGAITFNLATSPGPGTTFTVNSATMQFNGTAMGFFSTTAVAKQTATAYATIVANAGTAMLAGSTSTGGSGSTAYTFGDIVLALKNYGLLVV